VSLILFNAPHRHVIFAPGLVNSFEDAVFPGVHGAIMNATNPYLDPATSAGRWEVVKQQVDIVSMHIRHATQIISEPSLSYAPSAR
jgi:hypothetical protein